MIKICFIATIPFVFNHHIKNHIVALSELGYDVHVIASKTSNFKEKKFDIRVFPRITYYEVDIRRDISIFSDLKSLIKVYLYINKNNFQVVHSFTSKAGLISSLSSFANKTPYRLHTFIGQPWMNVGPLKRLIAKFCDQIIMLLNTQCYADSYSQKQFLKDELGNSANKIKVIGHGSLSGVDLERFCFQEDSKKLKEVIGISSEVVISFIGRVTKEKGVEEIIDSFLELEKLSSSPIKLLLIGPFENDQTEFNDKILNKIKLSSSILIIGYTERPELYLSFTDIFCLPSYREGFGTAVIEAAAMAIPSVVTRVVGLVDAVVDYKTGLFCDPCSVSDLTKKLLILLDNPKLRRCMGMHAKSRAYECFSSKMVIRNFLDDYMKYLKKYD